MTTNETIPYHRPMLLPQEEWEECMGHIAIALGKGALTNGVHVSVLERWFREYYHVKHAIATNNCTNGLLITLQAVRGMLVKWKAITPAFAWFSSDWALRTAGIEPIYEDIDSETWIMEEDAGVLSTQCEFSLPVHTFGNTAQNHSRHVVYDGAHALGSKLPDIGDATVFSLAPTKIITSIEGGIVITDNDLLAANITALRDKVCRLSEIHAIFGNAYLKHLDEVLKWKEDCFIKYQNGFPGAIFQKSFAHQMNWNTIGMLPPVGCDWKIPASIEYKKYYVPLVHGLKNTDYVYNHITCLPSYYNAPIDEIISRIKKENE